MARKLYPDVSDGQPIVINWRQQYYKMACCDCNLVHKVYFDVKGSRLTMRVYRSNRSTNALRHHRGVPIAEQTKQTKQTT